MSTQRTRATAVECVAYAQGFAVEYIADQECPDRYRSIILQLCECVRNVHEYYQNVLADQVSPLYSVYQLETNDS